MEKNAQQQTLEELARLRASYLDLLAESLIGHLNQDPPLQDHLPGYDDLHRQNGWDWPSAAPSMIGGRRMAHLRRECERVLAQGVVGDFMETGVWRGGACMMMRGVLKAYGVSDRRVVAADSFCGLPTPAQNAPPDPSTMLHGKAEFSISLAEVRAAFHRYGLLDGQVVFLEGWFKDTLPRAPVEQLAVLRLDGDLYESTMEGLSHLYPKLSEGGSLIVDDYFLFAGQRRAVDEYRDQHEIADPIVRIDDYGGFWIKNRGRAR